MRVRARSDEAAKPSARSINTVAPRRAAPARDRKPVPSTAEADGTITVRLVEGIGLDRRSRACAKPDSDFLAGQIALRGRQKPNITLLSARLMPRQRGKGCPDGARDEFSSLHMASGRSPEMIRSIARDRSKNCWSVAYLYFAPSLGDQPAVVLHFVERSIDRRPIVIALEDIRIDRLPAPTSPATKNVFYMNAGDAAAVYLNPLFGEARIVNISNVEMQPDPGIPISSRKVLNSRGLSRKRVSALQFSTPMRTRAAAAFGASVCNDATLRA